MNYILSCMPRSTYTLGATGITVHIIVKVSVFGFRAQCHAYTAVIMISPGYIILGCKKTE